MKAEQYLPGDTVLYVTFYFKGQISEVAQSAGERVCFTSGGCGLPENFTLIKRDGRGVKSVIVNPEGGARIEFQDSTIQWWVVYDERWGASFPVEEGVLTNEQFQTVHKDWTYEYQAPETPEPSNVRALNLDSALAEIKRRHQFCSEFYTPKAQEWTHPPVPSVGDYVRLTLRNGSTAEGEVKSVPFFRDDTWDEWCVRLDGGKGGYIFSTKHRTDTCILGDVTIVGVEHIEPPRELLWPKGTVVENNHTFALYRTAEDVYVGATEFWAELEAGLFRVRNYSKVVQP